MRGHISRRGFLTGALVSASAIVIAACSSESTGPEADLAKGSGAVLTIDGEKVAVYKGDDGKTIKLNPKCPHQGCDVVWDDAAKRWECPCHASQFEPDGTLITGPAAEGLEKLT